MAHAFSHLGLSTLDMDRTRAFYEGVLGFEVVRADTMEVKEGGRIRHVFFDAGGGQLVAFLASDLAAHVNGQIFGRRGYAYTLFQTPKPIAALYKEGGFTAAEIARNFDAAFREHLSVPGIPPTPALQQALAAAKKG